MPESYMGSTEDRIILEFKSIDGF